MPNCRHCTSPLELTLIDLGNHPPSNAYLTESMLDRPEITYPLKLFVCRNCWLVQLPAHVAAHELFTADYAYFSSMSDSWLAHSRLYVGRMAERFNLDAGSFVVEIASNDGYLLQFAKKRGIGVLGVEPTSAAAAAARQKGIQTEQVFFGRDEGRRIREQYGAADLMPANNVLAHVPDINDFVAGFAEVLAPGGVATFEFPHLLSLLKGLQFDTVYHEHYSYLSLTAVERILGVAGLRVFDIEELPTHGGSLRVFACHKGAEHRTGPAVAACRRREDDAGIRSEAGYRTLQPAAERIRDNLLRFLIGEKAAGRSVVAYGAAAKGNTLLNFAGVRSDLLSFVCDRAPLKQGRYLPGSHIPVRAPDALAEVRPDTVLILPWNIADEIIEAMSEVRDWGGRFAVAVPEMRLL